MYVKRLCLGSSLSVDKASNHPRKRTTYALVDLITGQSNGEEHQVEINEERGDIMTDE